MVIDIYIVGDVLVGEVMRGVRCDVGCVGSHGLGDLMDREGRALQLVMT